MFVEIQNKSI